MRVGQLGTTGHTKGFDTLGQRHRRRPAFALAYIPGIHFLPRTARTSRRPTTSSPPFCGSLGTAGSALARPLRFDDQPAAGDLDRLVAFEDDPHRDGARVLVPTTFGTSASRSNVGAHEREQARWDDWRRIPGHDGRRAAEPVGLPDDGERLEPGLARRRRPGANPDYPASSLSDRLKTAATLLSANLGVKVVTITGAGLTRTASRPRHGPADRDPVPGARRVRTTSPPRGIEQRVVTVVFTEFGRRVGENGTAGTRTSAPTTVPAAPASLMGSAVRGGLAGNQPSGRRCMNGNLGVTDRLPLRLADAGR